MNIKTIAIMLAGCTLFACNTPPTQSSAVQTFEDVSYEKRILFNEDMFSHEVKAYLACWSPWKAESVDGSKLTEVSVSFLSIEFIKDPNGEYTYNNGPMQGQKGYFTPRVSDINIAPETYRECKELRQQYPHLRISIALGGSATEGFSDAVLTRESRAEFAASIVEYVEANDFDGVDLDWEFPVNGGWGTIKARPEDWTNYALFIQQLRGALNNLENQTSKSYSITIAAHPSPQFFNSWVDLRKVIDLLDSVHIMTYDNFYKGRGTAYHNNDTQFTEDAIKLYLDAGFPADKILIGAAFYGKSVNKLPDVTDPINKPYPENADFSWFPYNQIKAQYLSNSEFIQAWDDELKAPYLWNQEEGEFVTYEDPRSIEEKTRLIKEYGIGGIFMWEYSQDHEGELLESMSAPFIKD